MVNPLSLILYREIRTIDPENCWKEPSALISICRWHLCHIEPWQSRLIQTSHAPHTNLYLNKLSYHHSMHQNCHGPYRKAIRNTYCNCNNPTDFNIDQELEISTIDTWRLPNLHQLRWRLLPFYKGEYQH